MSSRDPSTPSDERSTAAEQRAAAAPAGPGSTRRYARPSHNGAVPELGAYDLGGAGDAVPRGGGRWRRGGVEEPRRGVGGWLARLRRRLGLGAPASRSAGDEDAFAADGESGLHALTQSCDAWFTTELAQLEQDADEMARATAAANLPRVEVDYDEVAEEAELVARCRATLHGWADRVRTRVQDALESSSRAAGTQLKRYAHVIGALDGTLTELRRSGGELAAAERAAEAGRAHLELRPLLSRWAYVPLIALLVLVDWIANVPVFSELLPKDPGSETTWRELAARSETLGLWGGVYRIWARAVHNIDASLLALGVIVFLVYLAHVLGESLRRWASHSPADTPAAAPAIRAHRRQVVVPAVLSFVGIVTVVGVLWLARERVEQATADRVADTEARIETVQAALADARAEADLLEIGRLEQQLAGLQVLREQRIDRADYALVISRMNLPILFLNIVLALAAAVAGYLVTRGAVHGALTSPHAAGLAARIRELRADAVLRRDELRGTDAAIGRELARAEDLLASRPLAGWQAKADRLRAVVPRFRAENARLRGIDTANVAAFRRPPQLELVLREPDAPFARPAELDRLRAEHAELRGLADAVLERMHHGAQRPADDAHVVDSDAAAAAGDT